MKNKIINQTMRKGVAASALAGLAALLITTAPAVANAQVIPPRPGLEKAGYGDLLAKWWQWTLAFPANADPAADTAPQEANQSGPIWFLAGLHGSEAAGGIGTVTRQITIPEGTALFFPILALENDNTGCPDFTDYTAPELRATLTNEWSAVTETTCTIDGFAVRGIENPQSTPYLIQSPVFSYTLASSNNIVAVDFGEPCVPDGITVFPVVAEGVCLLVSPLSPGHHVIHFVGIVGPPSSPFVDFDETYDVTVAVPRGYGGCR
jgi:hypothetical protein